MSREPQDVKLGLISEKPIVAIVGAREADHYGLQLARSLGQVAATAGIIVLSGGAKGIDTAAHEGALEAGGESVAVLGCGLSFAPRRLKRLQSQGLTLVSPYPDDAPGRPWRFAKRNEHIATASSALIVVQASETSGSLISARHTLRLGRPTWVCPGPISSPHAGCYQLLQEGATLLSDTSAWLSSFDGLSATKDSAHTPPVRHQSPSVSRSEPPPVSALYQAASAEPMMIGELATRAQMSVSSALAEATILELSGWLTTTPTGAFVRVDSAA